MMRLDRNQQGSALLTALFLIVVVAALGVTAMRLGNDQRHTSTLEVLQMRATFAAHAGLEYWTRRAFANNNIPCSSDRINLNPGDRLDGFSVQASCTRIQMGTQVVYDITAVATHGVYGDPDFVSRRLRRRVTNMDPSNAGWQSGY
jgi:MSHA biogenesis protein MshP